MYFFAYKSEKIGNKILQFKDNYIFLRAVNV